MIEPSRLHLVMPTFVGHDGKELISVNLKLLLPIEKHNPVQFA